MPLGAPAASGEEASGALVAAAAIVLQSTDQVRELLPHIVGVLARLAALLAAGMPDCATRQVILLRVGENLSEGSLELELLIMDNLCALHRGPRVWQLLVLRLLLRKTVTASLPHRA